MSGGYSPYGGGPPQGGPSPYSSPGQPGYPSPYNTGAAPNPYGPPPGAGASPGGYGAPPSGPGGYPPSGGPGYGMGGGAVPGNPPAYGVPQKPYSTEFFPSVSVFAVIRLIAFRRIRLRPGLAVLFSRNAFASSVSANNIRRPSR